MVWGAHEAARFILRIESMTKQSDTIENVQRNLTRSPGLNLFQLIPPHLAMLPRNSCLDAFV